MNESRAAYRAYLLQTVKDVWTHFETNFRALWNEHGVDRVFTNTRLSRLLHSQSAARHSRIRRS